ncbi:fatty-acyl coenzyme A oxidase [Dimargaris cristalligena]|uniref:Acyl-coenzyme A oxidase n=1 Tax=Dimargaris cristalligena TaxID=215637 RepID=A0A4P9ZZA9_9FUNG|nr:fatty-acyl coenzyme A oxidase [Dimargaris cristalligena]RKP38748.1 acyl-CoA dehydrogenase/oxidase C-terminal [Dimargaris cristalligena]|eukprot:RKP38748.1 acyl-CoA dehydrogenase/oxidase C-terminal [Dimargaris cristalligena]
MSKAKTSSKGLPPVPVAPRPTESLNEERKAPSFPVREMTYFLDNGREAAEFKDKVMAQLERDPLWRMDNTPDLSLLQLRERTLAKFGNIINFMESEPAPVFWQRMAVLSVVDPAFWTRLGVHMGLFLGAVRGQATSEQLDYWVGKGAMNLGGMVGCFGMTELGHGSNVAGMETTATFDEENDEFVIHTPTVTATKWWIGGAAHSATHCAVYAQLFVKGVRHGVKTFVVPLRDPRTYNLLPGVTIGDIGKKMGRDGIDNGWIQFSYVRIPRSYMLMKHTKVTRAGEVIEPPMAQLAYGALIMGRVSMVVDSANMSKKALTIAIRYAAVRRQFGDSPAALETKLLDYPIHQYRLLPLLAQTFALNFTGIEMTKLYQNLMQRIDNASDGAGLAETIELLKETHATAAGLKAFGTWNCVNTIEQCRQSLGGHGYSSYTGLSNMYTDFVVQCTWEGDNTILTLQCGRYLVSTLRDHRKGKPLAKNVQYLTRALTGIKQFPGRTARDIIQVDALREAWAAVAASAVARATAEFEKALAKGLNKDQAYEQCSTLRLLCARLHCYGYLVNRFTDAIQRAPASLQPALTNLCLLYATYTIQENSGEFLQAGFFDSEQLAVIREAMNDLLAIVRKDAVPLVDAFNYTDYVINSPLGRYDGNVYEAYFNLVKTNNPKHNDIPYFDSVIKPLLTRTSEPLEAPQLDF